MLFWFIAFFASDEDEQQNLWTLEQTQMELRMRILVLTLMIGVGFLMMIAIAMGIRRNEKAFNISFCVFLIFVVSCEFAIFLSVMKMVKIQYGDEFRRRVFVQNGVKNLPDGRIEKVVELHYNDGTYIFDNKGRLTGKIATETTASFNKGDLDSHIKGKIEPKMNYLKRVFLGLVCLTGLTALLLAIMVTSLFYMMKVI